MAQPTSTPPRSSSFPALAVPEFRTLWLGQIFSAIGTWMQIVALSLIVLKLSGGSTAELGVVSLVQALAFFAFALPGGSVADRFDKRKLLMITQTTQGLLAALLGVLTASGHINIWSVIVLAFVSSAPLNLYREASTGQDAAGFRTFVNIEACNCLGNAGQKVSAAGMTTLETVR